MYQVHEDRYGLGDIITRPKLYQLFANPESWCKNVLWRVSDAGNLQHCIRGGAIKYIPDYEKAADSKLENTHPIILKVQAVIRKYHGLKFESYTLDYHNVYEVVSWNNHPDTTHEEFVRVLREADV